MNDKTLSAEEQRAKAAMNAGSVAIKHGGSGAISGRNPGRRLRLHDLLEENSPSVYIKSNAARMTKKVAHVLLPHKSSQSGDTFTIEVPNTFIPIDLANYAPKEELLKNPTLMANINSGLFTLLSTQEAEAELDQPDAIREVERLMAEQQRRMKSGMPQEGEDDGPMRAMLNPAEVPQRGAPGEINMETAGVSASVVAMFGPDITDEDRVVMLRNLEPTLSDKDRRYIRGKSNHPRIREIVG